MYLSSFLKIYQTQVFNHFNLFKYFTEVGNPEYTGKNSMKTINVTSKNPYIGAFDFFLSHNQLKKATIESIAKGKIGK